MNQWNDIGRLIGQSVSKLFIKGDEMCDVYIKVV